MTIHTTRWLAISLVLMLIIATSVPAEEPAAATDPQSPRYEQDEFAPLPTPDWVQMIDQGTLNPSLAGIETPEALSWTWWLKNRR